MPGGGSRHAADGERGTHRQHLQRRAFRRDTGIYGATKHAVNCINSTFREELQDDRIRAVSIMPGVFSTNFPRHFDRDLDRMAASVGVDLDRDAEGRMSRATLAELQGRLSPVMGDVARIADVVEFVVTQPVEVHIEEVVIRPPRSLVM